MTFCGLEPLRKDVVNRFIAQELEHSWTGSKKMYKFKAWNFHEPFGFKIATFDNRLLSLWFMGNGSIRATKKGPLSGEREFFKYTGGNIWEICDFYKYQDTSSFNQRMKINSCSYFFN